MTQSKLNRCEWVQGKADYYLEYHDQVWGKIVKEDKDLFKWLSLEIFHIGLSWQIVLSKYDNFMEAFDYFDYKLVAEYDEKKIDSLMDNKDIIRHQKKIEAIIHNAKQIEKIQREYGSFYHYLWSFTNGIQLINNRRNRVKKNSLSDKITKDLKSRNFKFIGSVTIYSYLEAIGIMNNHDLNCDFR